MTAPYDQDADHTPPRGIERPTPCDLCPTAIDDFYCLKSKDAGFCLRGAA